MKVGFEIVASKSETDLFVYDAIGEDQVWGGGISAKMFADAVKAVKTSRINLRINSPGGFVHDANAMVASLDNFKGEVVTYIDALAASAASVLAMAGKRIYMTESAVVMIHDPHMGMQGGVRDFENAIQRLKIAKTNAIKTYMRHSSKSEEELDALMTAETWWTATESVSNGFAHEIVRGSQVVNFADVSRFNYRNAPELKVYQDPKAVEATERLKQRIAELKAEAA